MKSRPAHAFRAILVAVASGVALAAPLGASASDLFKGGTFSAMVSDRHAQKVGDILTLLINENSTATNTTQKSTTKSNTISGQLSAGASVNNAGSLGLNSGFVGTGQSGRNDTIVAQVSVVVDGVMPNGDLHVSGSENLNINGEHTKIRISGRVRVADVSSQNTVVSTSLADAVIDYDGKGFAASSAKPGIVNRIFSWLGLI